MKLTEVHPCDGCQGPLLNPGIGNFYAVRSSAAMIDRRAWNGVAGVNQILGGNALGIAEDMAPDAQAIKVLGDLDPALYAHALICFECYTSKPLAEIQEGVVARLRAAEAAASAEGEPR